MANEKQLKQIDKDLDIELTNIRFARGLFQF